MAAWNVKDVLEHSNDIYIFFFACFFLLFTGWWWVAVYVALWGLLSDCALATRWACDYVIVLVYACVCIHTHPSISCLFMFPPLRSFCCMLCSLCQNLESEHVLPVIAKKGLCVCSARTARQLDSCYSSTLLMEWLHGSVRAPADLKKNPQKPFS